MKLTEIKTIIKKELTIEWRQKYAFNGILLYVGSTIFICYLSFNLRNEQLTIPTWNALFWIIMLFNAVNAVSKSFMQEKTARLLYYYSLFSGQTIIAAKIIYNFLLLLVISFLGYIVYSIVLRNPVQDALLFIVILTLASLSFSVLLTLISGIASKAGNNMTLMAVLSFPVIIPVLLVIIKTSKNALDGLERSSSYDELIVLISINLIVGVVSLILFPYLWRS